MLNRNDIKIERDYEVQMKNLHEKNKHSPLCNTSVITNLSSRSDEPQERVLPFLSNPMIPSPYVYHYPPQFASYNMNPCYPYYQQQPPSSIPNCNTFVFQNYDPRLNYPINTGYYNPQQGSFQELNILKDLIHLMKDKEVRQKRHKIKKTKIKKEKEVKLGSTIFCANKGDWQCPVPECKNWNYSKRHKCNMCSHPKKDHIIKGFVHYKENTNVNTKDFDWKCIKCSFLNSDFKDQCYRCSENKPNSSQQ